MNFFTRLSQRSLSHGTAIAHVRLWHFVASVEQALQPSLRTVPFAVVNHDSADGRVVDANEIARGLGVRAGVSVQRLRQRFPTVQVRTYNGERIAGFSKAFYQQAKRWGRIATSDTTGYVVTAIIPAVNALERAAVFMHIQEVCWRELECNIAVGIGSTVAFAKLATVACVEPGFRYLDAHEQQALNTLPVSTIPGIGRRTAHALVQLNVSTVWHFLQLDAQTIEQLGGRSLLRLYRQYVPVAALPFVEPLYAQPVPARHLFQSRQAHAAFS
jgi:nucleotidyltransferase/DNA polymerase involved in DNA repair